MPLHNKKIMSCYRDFTNAKFEQLKRSNHIQRKTSKGGLNMLIKYEVKKLKNRRHSKKGN